MTTHIGNGRYIQHYSDNWHVYIGYEREYFKIPNMKKNAERYINHKIRRRLKEELRKFRIYKY